MIVDTPRQPVDRLIDLYCDWRTRCQEVRATYGLIATTPTANRAQAYAAFEAALDREESAADAYAQQIGVLTAEVEPLTRTTR